MTASTATLFIKAEVLGQRGALSKAEIPISEKLDESIYTGMQGMWQALHRAIQ